MPRALDTQFWVIQPDLSCSPVEVGPQLYQQLDANYEGFKSCLLVAEHAFDSDWPTWEMHPQGDELLYLREGACRIHLWVDGQEQVHTFDAPGSMLKVPAGVWHTAKIISPCRILFITPGEGTANRVEPPVDDLA